MFEIFYLILRITKAAMISNFQTKANEFWLNKNFYAVNNNRNFPRHHKKNKTFLSG